MALSRPERVHARGVGVVVASLGALSFAGAFGCASSAGSAPSAASLDGTWTYTNGDATAGVVVVLGADGTYSFEQLQLTSATSANAEIETGTFVVSDGAIVFTPTAWSCPSPDPVSYVRYAFAGGALTLYEQTGIVTLQPGQQDASPGEAPAIGCFDANGSFTAEASAPVTN